MPTEVFRRGPLITRSGYTLSLQDRVDIAQLPSLFECAFCSGNFDALTELLTEDIVIDHALGYAEGKAEVAKLPIPSFGLRHMMTNQIVFINAHGEAALLSYLNAPQVVAETDNQPSLPTFYACCVVVDELRLGQDSLWRFSRRTFDQLKLADYLNISPEKAANIGQNAEQRGPQERPE